MRKEVVREIGAIIERAINDIEDTITRELIVANEFYKGMVAIKRKFDRLKGKLNDFLDELQN